MPDKATIALFALLWLYTASAFSQATAHRCERDGKVSYQDSPCTDGKGLSIKLPEKSDTDIRRDIEHSRQQAKNILATCQPGSTFCRNAQAALDSLDKLSARFDRDLENASERDLQRSISRTDAQINYRRAKEAYRIAESAVNYNAPMSEFRASLNRRSDASSTLSSARSAYYKAFGAWPDD